MSPGGTARSELPYDAIANDATIALDIIMTEFLLFIANPKSLSLYKPNLALVNLRCGVERLLDDCQLTLYQFLGQTVDAAVHEVDRRVPEECLHRPEPLVVGVVADLYGKSSWTYSKCTRLSHILLLATSCFCSS